MHGTGCGDVGHETVHIHTCTCRHSFTSHTLLHTIMYCSCSFLIVLRLCVWAALCCWNSFCCCLRRLWSFSSSALVFSSSTSHWVSTADVCFIYSSPRCCLRNTEVSIHIVGLGECMRLGDQGEAHKSLNPEMGGGSNTQYSCFGNCVITPWSGHLPLHPSFIAQNLPAYI